MTTSSNNVDFRGARGSNAGDQFHELWALQQVLELLQPDTDLKAVGVEGVRTETSSQQPDEPTWDSVDCALYYGGTSLENSDRIEFVQLKYSAANPDKEWSVARLTESTATKVNNSVIRKMADDFADASKRIKQHAALKVRLISNQGLSTRLKHAIGARWSGPLESAGLDPSILDDLKKLQAATGLDAARFRDFLAALDFSECGSQSRFSMRERVISAVAGLLGDDVSSEVRDLQVRIRELMLPERAREIITEKDVLIWFGLGGRDGLFPCPAEIQIPERVVVRTAADEAVNLLLKGQRLLLVHGVGGCGKTTLMHQIADRLPADSVTIFFDCFGGGRYMYSDDKRHLSENAFLHLTNELAVALRLPLFLPRSSKYPATIKSFMDKLRTAGAALKQFSANAILLIIIDAADNAVAAAEAADLASERPFIFDLFGANLDSLPQNVRIVTSARTARRLSLRLPPQTVEIVCPVFSLQETRQHLETAFAAPSDSLVEQFHVLSNAIPRVQAYAISTADGDRNKILDALLPGGKGLADVLKASFENALVKLGQPRIFDKLVGVLGLLPAPIALPSMARITGCAEDAVRDFAIDLVPGLRLHDNSITIADEDFDAFIKDHSATHREAVLGEIAADFSTTCQSDPYSALHVADVLIAAKRAGKLLSIIERDPQVTAIRDPIVRRQVQVRRLKLSLASCKEAGSATDALKTILISAEAERDDSTLNEMLDNEMDLAVEFAGPSLRRTILLDRERVEEHGSFLAQDAVRAIRSGDRVTAREQLHFHEAWLMRRREIDDKELDNWTITDDDIAARVETILELAGPRAAFRELRRWTPRDLALRVAFILIPRLIAAGKIPRIRIFLKEGLLLGPWDLLLWVPLAMAGEPVDSSAIEKSVKRIRRRSIPWDSGLRTLGEESWKEKLLTTFITSCELAFKIGIDNQVIHKTTSRILEVLEGNKQLPLLTSDVHRLDGLLRCWLLKEVISGSPAKDDNFLSYVKTLSQEAQPEGKRDTKGKRERTANQRTDQETEQRNRKIKLLFPVYQARLSILNCARDNQPVTDKHIDKLNSVESHSYELDYDYDGGYLREMAAQSMMSLIILNNIAVSELVRRASALAQGRYGDAFASKRRKLWEGMQLRTSEHGNLVIYASNAMSDIKGIRAASSEKMAAIIHLARLILPVSRDDAQHLFNEAVAIAKEIDLEAFAQIAFVSVLADHAKIEEQDTRTRIAADITTFVSGAAERLSGHEDFPWTSAVHALTCVNESTALASICRWADDNTARLHYTLPQFLLTGLRRNIISPEVAIALAMLIDGSYGDLRKELISHIAVNPQESKDILEELAKDTLLLSSQENRLRLGQEIINSVPQTDSTQGKWLEELKDTVLFLKNATHKTEDEEATRSGKPQTLANGHELPKEFVFDPQGKSFTTSEAIGEVLKTARASGLRYYDLDLLKRMRDASSSPKDRVPFLNAVSGIPEELIWDRLGFIRDTLDLWKGTPSVDYWCTESLPLVLIAHFNAATRWLKEGQSVLHQLLGYTEMDIKGRLQIILEGVSTVGETLSSRTLFAVAEEIARLIDKEESCKQLLWYSERLRNRLPTEDQSLYTPADVPNCITDAIARFLFAFMSDIDTRIRWKSAHALRRLAKLRCIDIINTVVSQSDRVADIAFREPSSPYYFLAARLWLTIALYRISVETPDALTGCKSQLFNLATSPELPHVGIREYGKRVLLQLASEGTISLTHEESKVLNQVNTALKGQSVEEKHTHPSFRHQDGGTRRFRFDSMDTLPYWYEDILLIFPSVSQEHVLDIAEKWIVDKWGADQESHWWDKEPRKARYDERRYELWSHRHGSLPTIERYGTHLEWHAMHCVIGELLTTHQISKEAGGEYGSFGYWLRKVLPTEPPYWLSDNRGPTPLERRLWVEDSRTDTGWLYNVRKDEFLTEIGTISKQREGWIVINGRYTARFPKRSVNIHISSTLVSPKTAAALVRALQTASIPSDFRIPDEDDELQIDSPPYRLLGLVRHSYRDMSFDDKDSFRYEVDQVHSKPGRKLTEALGLVPRDGIRRTWISIGGEAAFIYEAWCDEPPAENYAPRAIRSDGWRLVAKADIMRSFLIRGGWDLICEVQIDRRLHNEYERSYEKETKRKEHEKIILLRADGSVVDSKGRIGSWTSPRQATRP